MAPKSSDDKSVLINYIKDKSANTIINAFNNRVKLQIDKAYISMKGKVKRFKVIPASIGKTKQANIEALVEASYNIARREMPSPRKFYVYAYLEFASQGVIALNIEDRASKLSYNNAKYMLVQLVNRAIEMLQSDHEVLLNNFKLVTL